MTTSATAPDGSERTLAPEIWDAVRESLRLVGEIGEEA